MKNFFFNKKHLTPALLLFLFLTVMALLNFTRFVTSRLAEEEPPHYKYFFIMETTGIYSILIVLPFALWMIKKFPITRKNLLTHIPLHLVASMIYGVSHTMFMFSIRTFIFWFAGWGTYEYGRFIYKIPMEYTHQFFSYSMIYGIVMFVKYVREGQQQKVRASQLEQQLTKARLQALQMQLHPHFLFNTLNMISSTMYDDVKAADKMIANLSDLLRITLDSKGSDEHTLEKELELINLYIEIMKARLQDKLIVKTEIEHETQDALVPGFILQPLVENSIKFSLNSMKTAQITIVTQKEHGKLKLIIADNGPGVPENTAQIFNNGVGLSNTAERLEKLYGDKHSLQIHNISRGGSQVVIEIPFRLASG